MKIKTWIDRPLHQTAKALRAGEVSAESLCDEAIANHERFGQLLGAYKTWDGDGALLSAGLADQAFQRGYDFGPLQGFPISVKDLYGVRGLPVYAGSSKPLPEKWQTEGPVISSLRRQIAPITGKTHTVEFAFGGVGVNGNWPTPRNPWSPQVHRVPGGSSAGAGVSLCEGSAAVALGTDTAGSVRIPASVTGNAGLKTSAGRWSLDGLVPLSETFDSPGVLARSIEDIAYAFAAIDPVCNRSELSSRLANVRPDLAGLRIGVCGRLFWDDCSPGVAEAVEKALKEAERKGARIQNIDIPELDETYSIFRAGGLAAVELLAFLRTELPSWIETLDPNVAARTAGAGELSAAEFVVRDRRLRQLAATAVRVFDSCDVIVTPTVAITPPTVEEVSVTEVYNQQNMLMLRNTSIVSLLNLCAMTLPVGLDGAGMPVGMQVIGRRMMEESLILMARGLELAIGNGRDRLGEPEMLRAAFV
ncbi:amidase [Limibacillus sp. MBR-115]|jgi:aspartyl-tRNA(Asn)/glutamyl-tRNA(Gln) amidotransferase subunit A|uniref:amidase n=1 Tax=Limibacillus sp. MBR-115 TaxID=3156465 RepID=UPI003398B4C6